jgi:glycerol-3-phosphate dehydrogenase
MFNLMHQCVLFDRCCVVSESIGRVIQSLPMQRNTKTAADEQFDVAIIGGGAFGAAAAWDASLRGLRTILIEARDFGSGASSECFKMVHGGIRYLQHADIGRLRHSAHERSALLRIAPHLVQPLPIVIPTYGRGREGRFFLSTGARVYDWLTFDRNAGIDDPARRISPTRQLSVDEVMELFPNLRRDKLTGAVVFEDGQMYNPARLVLAFVNSAVRAGATALNYAEATEFLWSGQRVVGVRVRDRLHGDTFDVRARLVLNAAGPGAEYLLEPHAHFRKWKRGVFSRDAYFIINRAPTSPYALAVQGQSRDRDALLSRSARHLFVVPWRHYTLVGVWHKVFSGRPENAVVDEQELDAWVKELSASYPALGLKRDEIIYANCGLVPFGDANSTAETMSFGKESRFIDHRKKHGVEGLVTLIGIRFTTARADAAKALDMLLKQLPSAPRAPNTAHLPLIGGDISDTAALRSRAQLSRPAYVSARTLDALLRNHGTEYTHLLSLAAENPPERERLAQTDTIMAEVTYAVRSEMAMRLEDVVLRRTDMGSGSHPGARALDMAAARMQQLLGWSDRRRMEEVAHTDQVLRRHHARPSSTTETPAVDAQQQYAT